jgi:hypothetical protein
MGHYLSEMESPEPVDFSKKKKVKKRIEKFILKQQERIIVDYRYAARYIATNILGNSFLKDKIHKLLLKKGYSKNIA